jgi:hypothetical protein
VFPIVTTAWAAHDGPPGSSTMPAALAADGYELPEEFQAIDVEAIRARI